MAGRWINGPGEVVAPRALLEDAHLKIGDTFSGGFRGASVKLRVVGELYDFIGGPGGHELILDCSTITAVASDFTPSTCLVALKPGANVDAYVNRLAAVQPELLDVRANGVGSSGTFDAVLFAIAAVIALIAVAGIFNTLLLNTRERMRDTATLKALGMSPRQVIGMVAASAAFLALVGGFVAGTGSRRAQQGAVRPGQQPRRRQHAGCRVRCLCTLGAGCDTAGGCGCGGRCGAHLWPVGSAHQRRRGPTRRMSEQAPKNRLPARRGGKAW